MPEDPHRAAIDQLTLALRITCQRVDHAGLRLGTAIPTRGAATTIVHLLAADDPARQSRAAHTVMDFCWAIGAHAARDDNAYAEGTIIEPDADWWASPLGLLVRAAAPLDPPPAEHHQTVNDTEAIIPMQPPSEAAPTVDPNNVE